MDGLLINQNMAGLNSVGDNPVSLFKEKLDAAAATPGVCGVLLRINTPGGAVNATDVMFQELQNFRTRTRLPVVACVLDVAAGGGYFLAAGCDAIVASPTSVVGGVGVIWNSYNMRQAQGLVSISSQWIKAGEYIDMGTTLGLYSDEVKRMLQSMADDYHKHFRTRLKQARPGVGEMCAIQGEEKADPLDGRVMTAGQAVKCGLVDRLGYLDDATMLARHLSQQPAAGLVLMHRANDPGYSTYATTANTPIQNTVIPFSIPAPNAPGCRCSCSCGCRNRPWNGSPAAERFGPGCVSNLQTQGALRTLGCKNHPFGVGNFATIPAWMRCGIHPCRWHRTRLTCGTRTRNKSPTRGTSPRWKRCCHLRNGIAGQRFAFEHDRHSFLITRALVRTVLSRYAVVPPEAWTFVPNGYGKPEIAGPDPVPPLRFNVSHTRGLVACVVAWERDVGVDVEHLDRPSLGLGLAERYFAPAEVASLRRVPPEEFPRAFLDFWTLKEAYIKARGMGLALPLADFAFHLGPGAIRISFTPRIEDDPNHWQFLRFELKERHKVAVALRRAPAADCRLTLHFWS